MSRLKWHPPVGDPTKMGMCRHYNDPDTCNACRCHREAMEQIRDGYHPPRKDAE